MKRLFFLTCLLFAGNILAEESGDTWQNTTIPEGTIKKVQAAKLDYHKCVAEKMQKMANQDIDSRKATEEVIKQCETVLSKMREVYLAEKVPGEIADRHLRQLRIKTTRFALQEIMFNQANRKAE
jgi:hypothetical protein